MHNMFLNFCNVVTYIVYNIKFSINSELGSKHISQPLR